VQYKDSKFNFSAGPVFGQSRLKGCQVLEPIIEFIDFGFRYRAQKHPTLININLKIHKGEKILIAGPSGSGKSTLGSCINGLIPFNNPGQSTGILKINGSPPKSIFELSKTIGTVLQDTDGQFVGLSSGEDIAFSLENTNIPTAEMKARVATVAQMVGAENYLSQSPYDLSGGQKQRVSMAGVMISNEPLLLFDEPLAALDPLTGKTAIALIDDIANQTGATILIIEHRLEDVLYKKVDRIILISQGKIVAEGTPDEIVSSNLLKDCGVREPLYCTALKYAGIKITPGHKPGYLDTLGLSETEIREVRTFYSNKDNSAETDGGFLPHCAHTSQVIEKSDMRCLALPTLAPDCPKTLIDKHSSQNYAGHADLVSPLPSISRHVDGCLDSPAGTLRTPVLEVRNLSFAYDSGKTVLQDINFTLHKGEMTAIVGANGAGKSSFAKILVGFERQSTGELLCLGEDLSQKTIAERALKIGYVMQNPNQMITKTIVFDEVALSLRVRGVPEDEIRQRVSKTLRLCGLERFLTWPISALSYGQKKRVTIADALVLEPEILILDEPTAGQDWYHYTQILDFLKTLNDTKGIAVIMITHDMHLCLEYARRALVFSQGRLLCDALPAVVLSDPDLARRASLKETSLYGLSKLVGCKDGTAFARKFIEVENHGGIRLHS